MARNFNLVKYYSSKIHSIYLKQSRKTSLMKILARYEGCLELESIPVGFCWLKGQVYSAHGKLPCSQLLCTRKVSVLKSKKQLYYCSNQKGRWKPLVTKTLGKSLQIFKFTSGFRTRLLHVNLTSCVIP